MELYKHNQYYSQKYYRILILCDMSKVPLGNKHCIFDNKKPKFVKNQLKVLKEIVDKLNS